MDNEQIEQIVDTEPDAPAYTPRPKWQIVAAWIGVVVMVICVALYYWHIASGGMR